jgi:hypothetical protein
VSGARIDASRWRALQLHPILTFMESPMAMRLPVPLVLLALLCCDSRADDNARSTLDPSKAIVGHWETESGRTHYYFGDGKLTMVDDGTTSKMTYKVLSEVKDEVVLKLKIETGEGSHHKTLRFSTSRKGLLETVTVDVMDRKISVSTIWKYVDDKTVPKQ